MIYIIIILLLAGIDLTIKYGIEHMPDDDLPRDMPHTSGHIRITKFHNTGLPFGMLRQYPEMVKLIPLAITSLILGRLSYMLPKKKYHMEKLSYAILIGGALSNLYDRFARGYVVDYFSFAKMKIKKLSTVIYNIGDMCVFVGGTLLLIVTVTRDISTTLGHINKKTKRR